MKIYMITIALFLGIIFGSTSLFAKDYTEKDVIKKGNLYYDTANKPLTGRYITNKNAGKTIVTVKNGKRDGDTLLYINSVLRLKDTYIDGQVKVKDTYWSNGKLRTHTPIMARYTNGSLSEKHTNEPTKWYYKNGKQMLEQTMSDTKFYNKNGKLLAQASSQNISKSFCMDKEKQIPLKSNKLDILLNEYDRIFDNPLDDKEMDFSKFKCS